MFNEQDIFNAVRFESLSTQESVLDAQSRCRCAEFQGEVYTKSFAWEQFSWYLFFFRMSLFTYLAAVFIRSTCLASRSVSDPKDWDEVMVIQN